MIEGGAIGLIMRMLESQDNNVRWSAVHTVRGMAEYGAISHSCIIVELTDSTENFRSAMVEVDVIKLILKMLESQDHNIRWSAVHTVGGMAEHGAISHHSCMIIELTGSI
jgi:HEAT repeat protein